MKKIFVFPVMILGAALSLQAQTPPTKVVTIQVQTAILSTKDGQKAAAALQTKFAPKRSEFEKKKADIEALQDQLKKGQATMAEDARTKLMRDIDTANTKLQRETQDAQSDLDEEQQKIMQELGNKMMAVIEKYAQSNGIALVIDVSNPQTPVLWGSASIDITGEIVKLYDQANPGTGAAHAPAHRWRSSGLTRPGREARRPSSPARLHRPPRP